MIARPSLFGSIRGKINRDGNARREAEALQEVAKFRFCEDSSAASLDHAKTFNGSIAPFTPFYRHHAESFKTQGWHAPWQMSANLRHPATPVHLLLLFHGPCLLWAVQRRIEMEQTEKTRISPSTGLLAGWISSLKLAEELGLTVEPLGRWQRQRTGPACIKAGRKVYYRRSVVENWLLAQETSRGKRTSGRK
jgi:hypothetical protein